MAPTLRTPFTAREGEVAELIGDNLSNKQIGAQLGLSHFTVRSYVVRMASKLDFGRQPHPEPRVAVYAYVLYRRFVAGSQE